jgi:hypothetical protein
VGFPQFANSRAGRIASCDPVRLQAPAPEAVVRRGWPAWPSDLRVAPVDGSGFGVLWMRHLRIDRSPTGRNVRSTGISRNSAGGPLPARCRSLVRSGEVRVAAGKEVSASTTRRSSSASTRRSRRSPTSTRCSCYSSGAKACPRKHMSSLIASKATAALTWSAVDCGHVRFVVVLACGGGEIVQPSDRLHAELGVAPSSARNPTPSVCRHSVRTLAGRQTRWRIVLGTLARLRVVTSCPPRPIPLAVRCGRRKRQS